MNPKASTLLVCLVFIYCRGPGATAFLLRAANRYALHARLRSAPSPARNYATKKPDRVADEPEITVFDAEGEMSWEEYKSKKPDEYKLSETDEMLCWENDECPVEDESKYTKAWRLRSAEKNPTMETHFDSEGEWEEENQSAWSKNWYEDVGADDLDQEPNVKPQENYNI